jgi:hypothetical protein
MSSKSKAKGSGFEREVCKFLTEHYGETFTRVPNSGAFIGGKNSGRKEFLHEGQIRSFKGDIIPGQSFPKLNVECKNYADFGFHLLLTENSQIEKWLEQLLDVEDVGDLNVLFMKFNRIGKYVVVQVNQPWDITCSHTLYRSSKWGDWMVYDFDTFFKLNSEIFKTLSK